MLYVSCVLPLNALTVACFKRWMKTGSKVHSCTPVVIFLASSSLSLWDRGVTARTLGCVVNERFYPVIASFLHSGGNGNIRICWISSGRGILEVCQHGKKHIWQVTPVDPFFRAAFLAKFLGLSASAVLLFFHRNVTVLFGVGVFHSECVNTYCTQAFALRTIQEKVPI